MKTLVSSQRELKDTIMNFPKNTIDKIIESMNKRIVTIIKNRGQRLTRNPDQ